MQQIERDCFSVAKRRSIYIHVSISGFTRSSIYIRNYVAHFVWSENFRYVVDSNLIGWMKYWAIEYPVVVEVR